MTSEERIAPVTNLFGDRREPPPSNPPAAVAQLPVETPVLAAVPQSAAVEGAAPESALPDSAEPEVAEPRPARAVRRAENVSLAGLTRRNMSRWEIEKLLRSRDIDEEIIIEEISRLEGVGLIDDAALAETLVRTGRERKGLGRQALISELRRRHIDNAIIDEAVAVSEEAEDSEQQRASELAIKRARALESYDLETAKRRLIGFLMRKGYNSSIVQAAVAEALSGRPSGRATSGVRFQ